MKCIIWTLGMLLVVLGATNALDYKGDVKSSADTIVVADEQASTKSVALSFLGDDGKTITGMSDTFNWGTGIGVRETTISNFMDMWVDTNGHVYSFGYSDFIKANKGILAINTAQIQLDNLGNPTVTIVLDEIQIPGLTPFQFNANPITGEESPDDALKAYSRQLLHDFFANGKVGVDISRGFDVPLSDDYNGVTCEWGWSGFVDAKV